MDGRHFRAVLSAKMTPWRCDTLCTSGFLDNFMFSYHGTYFCGQKSGNLARIEFGAKSTIYDALS